ncbi:hypothetical protein WJX77_009487 [Trebouxia sp. C0004]
MDVEETQVSVRFVTKLPDQLKVPEEVLSVPAKLTRLGLSQVVNSLLSLDPAQPFDFLILGELLRQPLEKFLLAQSVSTETVLQVEYFKAVIPPQLRKQLPHDDWVSAVDGSQKQSILTGSYDGILRLWNNGGKLISSTQAHKQGINAVSCLPSSQGALALSAGKDHSIRLWAAPALNTTSSGAVQPPTCLAVYKGHTDSVEDVAASPSGSAFCSGAWDGNVHIWQTGREVALASEEAALAPATASKAVSKKRKLETTADASSAVAEGPLQEAAKAQLQGHSQCVSGVAWPDQDTIYSGSWDHSIRRWDAETLINTDIHNGNKAIYCIAAAAAAASVVAFGGADRAWRLWDSRQSKKDNTGSKAFNSHTDWITSVAWSPHSEHQVLTSSHDKSAKLWDTRAAVPLHTLEGHTDKVLCAGWCQQRRAATGGADCKLMLYDLQD